MALSTHKITKDIVRTKAAIARLCVDVRTCFEKADTITFQFDGDNPVDCNIELTTKDTTPKPATKPKKAPKKTKPAEDGPTGEV